MEWLHYLFILVLLLIFINFNYLACIIFFFYSLLPQLSLTMSLLNTNLVDLFSSILIDYFFFNNFYFLWTNLWYISTYFIVISYAYVCFNSKVVWLPPVTFVNLYIFILACIHYDLINSSFFSIDIFIYPYNENSLLTNSINNVHPFLLHSSFSLFLTRTLLIVRPKLQFCNFIIYILYNYINNFVLILVCTLYLGSWWALQEGSWGGWWNWDVSEVFGLILLLRILFYLHLNSYVVYLTQLLYYTSTSTLFFIFFYTSMQVNFSIVSHNFGFSSLNAFNPELFFIVFMVFTISLLLSLLLSYLCSLSFLSNYPNPILSLKYPLVFFISIFIYISVISLIQNFMWNTFEFNALAINFDYNTYLILLLITSLPFSLSYNFFLILHIYLFFLNLFYALFFHINIFSINYAINLTHFILIFALIVTSFLGNSYVNVWLTLCNDASFASVLNYAPDSINMESSCNFLNQATSPEGKSFYLTLTNSFLLQTYFPAGELKNYSIQFIDTTTSILNVLLWLFLFILFISFYTKFNLH